MKKILLLASIFFLSASCSFFGFGKNNSLGLVKTVDGGATWTASNKIENNAKASISSITVSEINFDPSDHKILYIGSSDNGFWVSHDSGATWKQLLAKMFVRDFVIDPANSKNIYISGIFDNHGKIVSSADGGATWTELYNEAGVANPVTSIAANPQNIKELYATLDSGIVIKSIDGGVNWFVVNDFKSRALRIRYNPVNNRIYALDQITGILESVDGGLTWTSVTQTLTGDIVQSSLGFNNTSKVGNFLKMALDDSSAGVIYTSTEKGLYKSTDDGQSWVFLNLPASVANQTPRAIASANGGMIAYTSVGATIFKTLNGGQSWQTQELPTTGWVNRILIDPGNLEAVYAGLIAAP